MSALIQHIDIEPATEQYPRSDTASIVELSDGKLMVTYQKYEQGVESGNDHGLCQIWSKVSVDGGKSWYSPRLLIKAEDNDLNVQAPALLRRKNGQLMLACLHLHRLDSSTMSVFSSSDEGYTFTPVSHVWKQSNGLLLQGGASSLLELDSGRLLLPFHGGQGEQYDQTNTAGCFFSDDDGRSWQCSNRVELTLRGAMEPSIAELNDGTLVMALRTQLGGPYISRSTDGGQSWSAAISSRLEGGESCTCVRRIPDDDAIVLFWNGSAYEKKHHHYGQRTPLSAAISRDHGHTWQHLGCIAHEKNTEYTNLDCIFTSAGHAILTYMQAKPAWNREQISLKAAWIESGWFEVHKDASPLSQCVEFSGFQAEAI